MRCGDDPARLVIVADTAVLAVRMLKVSVDQTVDMIAMRHRLMATSRAMNDIGAQVGPAQNGACHGNGTKD